MSDGNATTPIALNDKVRFTAERLSMLTAPDRKRLEGRVGVVQGHWNHSRKLTVYFPAENGKPELRILSIDPRQLERVCEEAAKTAETPPQITDESSDNDQLSQEDMDKLFG